MNHARDRRTPRPGQLLQSLLPLLLGLALAGCGGEMTEEEKARLDQQPYLFWNGDGEVQALDQYDEQGKLLHRVELDKEGEAFLRMTAFHESGEPMADLLHLQGKRAGIWRTFDEKGRLVGEMDYRNEDEPTTWSALPPEVDRVVHGTFEREPGGGADWVRTLYFDPIRKQKVNSFTEEGLPHGTWTTWYPPETSDQEDLVLRETGEYEDGLRQGVWTTYYRTGKVLSKVPYKDGERHGVARFYPDDEGEDGEPVLEVEYANGKEI